MQKLFRSKRFLKILAILAIICMVMTLALRLWADKKATSIKGPIHITCGHDRVYVYMHRTLYQLDTAGRLLNTVNALNNDLKWQIVDLQALSDMYLLVGDGYQRTIYKCNTDLTTCNVVLNLPQTGKSYYFLKGQNKKEFDFFLDEHNQLLFTTDSSSNSLEVYELPFGQRHRILDEQDLHFPNDVWARHDGSIRVANTSYLSVAGIRINNLAFEAFENDIPGHTKWSKKENIFPVAVINGPNDTWWVLNTDQYMDKTDLMVYGKNGYPLKRIELPRFAGPKSLAKTQNRVFAADPRLFKVYTINPTTYAVKPFGDFKLQLEFNKLKLLKKDYRKTANIALYAMAPILLSCILIYRRTILLQVEKESRKKKKNQ
ncbi:MAG: hypothetical protein GY874_03100 [Desulfobacteraceae bacterium]|nr:hypothetical protein [Desulfobacteraceae bacterium]